MAIWRATQMMSVLALLGAGCSSVPAGGDGASVTETDTAASTREAGTIDPIADETARLNTWFETQFEEELAFSPIQQTFLGRKTNYDKIDDFSLAGDTLKLDWKRASVAEMQATFDYDQLTPEAQTSYDVWAYQLAEDEASFAFQSNAYIFDQMSAVHAFFPQLLIAFHKVETLSDMEAYIARIRAVGPAMAQLIQRSKDNAAGGVRPPLFAFETVMDEARKIISGAPFDTGPQDSDIWADAQGKIAALVEAGTINERDAAALRADTQAALLTEWVDAYQALIAWQQQDIAHASLEAQGVSALPNGAAYYNERLANQTTTSLSAEEIHEIGLKDVARLRAEMLAIKDEVGFEADLQAFFALLRDSKTDERFYYPDTDAGRLGYIEDATAAIDKIKAELPNYFGVLPKADLEVKRVEPFREQDGAAQHYYPGTPDGSRPGIYYAHLSDMSALPKRELEVIAYHEGLPGHHMQISIAQELEAVPTFRTQAGFTAYIEGWALYAEYLALEMAGTYQDPYSRFGRIGSEIWRAIRLVVDTGLHTKGWSEEKAVAYFKANSAITEAQARSEVRRYLVLPGQATSYKIGMLKIQELRARAETALGEAFDIRGFHDVVLSGGALPLAILEKRIDGWIAAERFTDRAEDTAEATSLEEAL